MTKYHILNEKVLKENSKLNILLNDDNEKLIIDLKIERAIYYNKDCDITIIQLSEKDKIKNFLKLDEIIFKDNIETYYEGKSIYVLHYPTGKNAYFSCGLLNNINKLYINHKCSTDNGSAGSPILNLENNKVIGIQRKGSGNSDFNLGTLLKSPINDFIQINKNMKFDKNISDNGNNIQNGITADDKINQNNDVNSIKNHENYIIAEFYITPNNVNREIQIFNTYNNSIYRKDYDLKNCDNEKELRENIEIKMDGKYFQFYYTFKFRKAGKNIIEYYFKNPLTKTCFLFCYCSSLIS